MTRAQQTVSIGLLVSSVGFAVLLISVETGLTSRKVYLACFLQLIPFSPKIQEDIIPVVCPQLLIINP